jgi:hypothetical protein
VCRRNLCVWLRERGREVGREGGRAGGREGVARGKVGREKGSSVCVGCGGGGREGGGGKRVCS